MRKRKILEGKVVSDKMQKTIVVMVTKKRQHPLYKRLVTRRQRYKAHDPQGQAKVGDRVRIEESRPYSKDKRFCLKAVVQ